MQQESNQFSSEALRQNIQKFQWKDIDTIPIKQITIKNPNLALQIIVPEKFKTIQHRFQYLLQNNELSQRCLALTAFILESDSNNYYAMMIRKNAFEYLKKDPKQQIKFVQYLLHEDTKCYQLWTYRKFLARLLDFEGQFQLIEQYFKEDMNNYHAWSYRIWLVQQSNSFQKQWISSNKIRQQDFRSLQCNSYWSYRMFLLQKLSKLYDDTIINQQIKISIEILKQKNTNECVWNYLNGFFNILWNNNAKNQHRKYQNHKQIRQLCEQKQQNRFSKYTLYLIFKQQHNVQQARKIIEQLIQDDPTRKKYYQYLLQQLNNK